MHISRTENIQTNSIYNLNMEYFNFDTIVLVMNKSLKKS